MNSLEEIASDATFEEKVAKLRIYYKELWEALEGRTLVSMTSTLMVKGQVAFQWYAYGAKYVDVIRETLVYQLPLRKPLKRYSPLIMRMPPSVLPEFAMKLFELGEVYAEDYYKSDSQDEAAIIYREAFKNAIWTDDALETLRGLGN